MNNEPTSQPSMTFHSFWATRFFALVSGICIAMSGSHAGNCLITDGKKIGDCENVHVGQIKPLNVTKNGSHSGNYTRVTVQSGVHANISGNTDDVFVRAGATLHLSGNSNRVRIEGTAEISGNSGWVFVAKGGRVTISGIVDGVSGPGEIVKIPGSIIGGIYTK